MTDINITNTELVSAIGFMFVDGRYTSGSALRATDKLVARRTGYGAGNANTTRKVQDAIHAELTRCYAGSCVLAMA